MKADELKLLGRIDERTGNTWNCVEKMEAHLTKLNGSVRTNTIWRKCIIGVGASLFLSLFGLIAYVAGFG